MQKNYGGGSGNILKMSNLHLCLYIYKNMGGGWVQGTKLTYSNHFGAIWSKNHSDDTMDFKVVGLERP